MNNKMAEPTLVMHAGACLIGGDVLWMFHEEYNLLVGISTIDGAISHLSVIPNELPEKSFLYTNMEDISDSIVLIPQEANELALYDKKIGAVQKIVLPEEMRKKHHALFCGVHILNGSVYAIPYYNDNAVLCMSIESKELSWLHEMEKLNTPDASLPINYKSVCCGNSIFCTLKGTNQLIEYNIANNTAEICSIGEGKNYYNICSISDCLVLEDQNNNELVVFDTTNKTIRITIPLPHKNAKLFGGENVIYVDSKNSGDLDAFDLEGKVVFHANTDAYASGKKMIDHSGFLMENHTGYLWFDRHSDRLFEIDKQYNMKDCGQIVISGEWYERMKSQIEDLDTTDKSLVNESEYFSLPTYLNHVAKQHAII